MRFVDQNLYYSKFLPRSLRRLSTFDPDIFVFQEFSETKFASMPHNPLASYNMHLPKKHKEFTNCIISKYPPTNVGELHMNDRGDLIDVLDPILHDSVVLFADFVVNGFSFRIYNCHFSVAFSGFLDRAKMLRTVVEHAISLEHVLIMGDMNTTIPEGHFNRFLTGLIHHSRFPKYEDVGEFFNKSEKFYFNSVANSLGYADLLDIKKNTWRFPYTPFEICNLKLDWVLQRGFNKAKATVLDNTPLYLDHKTLIVDL